MRLQDLKQSCRSNTPGADIAAIGAIGSVARYQFAGDVLFDFDQATLKAEAKELLLQWSTDFAAQSGRLQIYGHTDLAGTEDYNLKLSKRRAQAVAYLLKDSLKHQVSIETFGLGESQPLVSAGTKEQAARNRRVEIIYFPN